MGYYMWDIHYLFVDFYIGKIYINFHFYDIDRRKSDSNII